ALHELARLARLEGTVLRRTLTRRRRRCVAVRVGRDVVRLSCWLSCWLGFWFGFWLGGLCWRGLIVEVNVHTIGHRGLCRRAKADLILSVIRVFNGRRAAVTEVNVAEAAGKAAAQILRDFVVRKLSVRFT